MPVRGLGIFGAFLFNMETEKTTEQELDEVNQSIIELEENIEFCYNQIKIKESYLEWHFYCLTSTNLTIIFDSPNLFLLNYSLSLN